MCPLTVTLLNQSERVNFELYRITCTLVRVKWCRKMYLMRYRTLAIKYCFSQLEKGFCPQHTFSVKMLNSLKSAFRGNPISSSTLMRMRLEHHLLRARLKSNPRLATVLQAIPAQDSQNDPTLPSFSTRSKKCIYTPFRGGFIWYKKMQSLHHFQLI